MDIHVFWDRGAPQGLEIPVTRIIAQIYDIPVQVHNSPLLYNGFVVGRRQFDATSILTCLDTYKRRNQVNAPLLLVIPDDIFRPATRFVYGLARPHTGSAVVSAARLRNEFWDLPPDDSLLSSRLVTEGAHELGHLFGLEHCSDQRCVMANPRSLDDLNQKNPWLCNTCKEKMERQNPHITAPVRSW